jgi:hypothetical protein
MRIPWLDSLPPRRRKWILWTVGSVLFYTIAGFLIAPPIVRVVAAKRLATELHREVSIAKVRLNPYAFSATVRGLLIKDKDGQPFVSWDELYVNLSFFSLFTRTLTVEEFRTTQPFLRVQVNPDYRLNFSDILEQIAREAAAAPKPAKPSKPRGLRIGECHISGVRMAVSDLTTRVPFHKTIGPLELTLQHFATNPENDNPYSFTGTTQEGERFSWSGHFFLDPVRSVGEFALENISLAKYAPLYQDLVRFQITDGTVDVRAGYVVEQGVLTNNRARLTNASIAVRSLKLAEAGAAESAVEVPQFAIAGAQLDAFGRAAEVGSITTRGGRLAVRRNADASLNLVDLAQPSPTATNASGSVVLLLQSVTNLVDLLLRSTNSWAGTIHRIELDDYAVRLEDLSTPRPARLDLDQIHVDIRNISNRPGSNLTAAVALRWNTNGSIRSETTLGLFPVQATTRLTLSGLDIRALDPYLDPFLNLRITQGEVGMEGQISLTTTTNPLPDLSFRGGVQVQNFATVDGLLTQDFLQFKKLQVSGIDAALNPMAASVKEISLEDAHVRLAIDSPTSNNVFTVLRKVGEVAPGEPVPAQPPPPTARTKKPLFTIPTNLLMAAQASLPKVTLDRIALTNVAVEYVDRSLKPPVHLSLDALNGAISGLSSEDLSRAEVDLQGKVGKTAPMEVHGKINLLSRNDYTDIKVLFNNIELIPTSPYAGKFLGYRLTKGKLSLDVHYELANGKLKAQNLITLDQLILGEKVPSPDATKLPVKLAIAILKDRSGRIDLDVPIEGSLADPEFKLGKVITRTLLNVLTKIVTSPFAALGSIFGGKGEEVSFQDFAAGSSELTPASREKLDAMAKGLYERPGLQLEIEPSTDPAADGDALRRLKLEKTFRTQKWTSLRKSERAQITAEQVQLTPEDYQNYLKQAAAALPPAAGVAATNRVATVSQTGEAVPKTTSGKTTALGANPEAYVKGATALISNRKPEAPARAQAQVAIAPDLEKLVLATIPISDTDFAQLATARAKRVQEYLATNGKVEAERMFLAEKPDETKPAQGSRVYLHLR